MDKTPKIECIIKGTKQHYDACSEKDLDKLKNYYEDYTYIGSGTRIFIDDIEQKETVLTHFFVKNF